MKTAFSSLAWFPNQDKQILRLLDVYNISAVEIAPTKIWSQPTLVGPNIVSEYGNFWKNAGKEIIATQAILFGHPELTIFESAEVRNQTLKYLGKMIEVTANLGAKKAVFGSPKNRLIGVLEKKQASEIAYEFFYNLGEKASKAGVYFCIEPNPSEYGADFVLNTEDAIFLIEKVNHPAFQLHLDTGVMTVNKEDIAHSIKDGAKYLKHLHVSEPNLDQVGEKLGNHKIVAGSLRAVDYQEYVSVEMRDNVGVDNLYSIEKAMKFLVGTYG